MSDVNVLVVFSTRYGATERVALAAGLGAIEAEANIRLRRVPQADEAAIPPGDDRRAEVLARLGRDYVAPRPADPAWAHVVIAAAPAAATAELCAYFATLPGLGSMAGKVAATLTVDDAGDACGGVGLERLVMAARAAGLTVRTLDEAAAGVERARRFGSDVVEAARQAAGRA